MHEVFMTNQLGHGTGNRNQKALRRIPTAHRLPNKRRLPARTVFPVGLGDLVISRFPLEQLIQGSKLLPMVGFQVPPLMSNHKFSEPLTQPACLCSHRIQRTRERTTAETAERARRREVRSRKPLDQIIAVGEPFDRRVHRSCNGIEEIDSGAVTYKYRRRASDFHSVELSGIALWTKVSRIRPLSRIRPCPRRMPRTTRHVLSAQPHSNTFARGDQ
jgi:hypothetical protein